MSFLVDFIHHVEDIFMFFFAYGYKFAHFGGILLDFYFLQLEFKLKRNLKVLLICAFLA